MSRTDAECEVRPFANDPLPAAQGAMRWLLTFAIGGAVGWASGYLTAALLTAMAIYGVCHYIAGENLLREIRKAQRANDRDWRVLRTRGHSDITRLADGSNASVLLRAAAALVRGHNYSGRANVDAVVNAVCSDFYGRISRLDITVQNCPRMGLAGTAVGLLVLYSGIDVGQDAESLVSSVLTALGGMRLAVSTTLFGVALEWMLNIQRAAAEDTLNDVTAQMEAQLSLLRLEK